MAARQNVGHTDFSHNTTAFTSRNIFYILLLHDCAVIVFIIIIIIIIYSSFRASIWFWSSTIDVKWITRPCDIYET